MTIDEAIEKFKFISNSDTPCPRYCMLPCDKCVDESKQLAEWLGELKDYRDKNKMVVRVDVENMDSIKDKIEELSKYAEIQYDNAIDDFVESVKNLIADSSVIRFKDIDEIAEQLKAGGNIELSEHSKSQGNRTGK